MPDADFQTLLRFFKALADETRLKLLGLLANQEQSVEELAVKLRVKPPTISHHLAKLKEAGLVSMRLEGNTHIYWLDAKALQALGKELASTEHIASALLVDDVVGDTWERKVLKDFFEGTHLKAIPASRRKRSVVLKWFANQFEREVLYSEKQVNEIIQRAHEDTASIRRELIGEHLMQRESGLYRRV